MKPNIDTQTSLISAQPNLQINFRIQVDKNNKLSKSVDLTPTCRWKKL